MKKRMLIVAIFFAWPSPTYAQRVFNYDPVDARVLLQTLSAAVNPASPQLQYMPPFVLEKLAWVRNENQSGRLEMRPVENVSGGLVGTAILASGAIAGRKGLEAMLPKLLYIQRIQYGVARGYDRRMVNFFALSLTHEAIHLELDAETLEKLPKAPRAKRLQEEMRAWRIMTIQGTRPLRLAGEPVDSEYAEVDDILRSCKDRECPAFRSFVSALMPQ